MYLYILTVFIFLNIVCDINYFIRTFISVLSWRFYQRKYYLSETTTIYGLCTFQDCDIKFKHIRIGRLLRDLDFARYHFYVRIGIYHRSRLLNIKSLQGCTLTVTSEPVPLFALYKINTALVYWDDRSLFFKHEIITLSDEKIRSILISRQHAIGSNGDSTAALLAGLPGSELRPACPEYIQHWLHSMQISSSKLKQVTNERIKFE